MNRSALHVGLLSVCAAMSLYLSACGGNAAAPTTTPSSAANASPAPSPPRPGLASPVASPSAAPGVVSATPSTTASLTAGGDTYEVQSGDTLATISQQFYGDPTQWRRIYDANKDAIGDDPDKLKLGTKLTIPPKQS
ncbi:MAG: LysM peptidoglycan-binding domain-containing protein [Chloroflexi bacterium]|nr:LysM peptidoglycan-binding domain-containing protein [Chloroflexota bacterium]MBV9597457.1 LysM peptidoglycan-binding domain-containing protein [Chloroflexota bacterium]